MRPLREPEHSVFVDNNLLLSYLGLGHDLVAPLAFDFRSLLEQFMQPNCALLLSHAHLADMPRHVKYEEYLGKLQEL
jgi:hypothetical protein